MLHKEPSPSIPILPSPSLSPALRKALVSLSVSALAVAEKFCRNSLACGQKKAAVIIYYFLVNPLVFYVFMCEILRLK